MNRVAPPSLQLGAWGEGGLWALSSSKRSLPTPLQFIHVQGVGFPFRLCPSPQGLAASCLTHAGTEGTGDGWQPCLQVPVMLPSLASRPTGDHGSIGPNGRGRRACRLRPQWEWGALALLGLAGPECLHLGARLGSFWPAAGGLGVGWWERMPAAQTAIPGL